MTPPPQVLAECGGIRTQPLPLGVFLASLCLLALAGFVVRPPSATEDREEIAAFVLAREPLRRDRRAVDVPRQPGGGDEHPLLVNRPAAVASNERARFSLVVRNSSGGQYSLRCRQPSSLAYSP